MFYISQPTGTTIYVNRCLSSGETYTLTYLHKDEYNLEYSEDLIPVISNERYSTLLSTLELKKGFYKFYIYNSSSTLIYNDLCFVNLENFDVTVVDSADNVVVID